MCILHTGIKFFELLRVETPTEIPLRESHNLDFRGFGYKFNIYRLKSIMYGDKHFSTSTTLFYSPF